MHVMCVFRCDSGAELEGSSATSSTPSPASCRDRYPDSSSLPFLFMHLLTNRHHLRGLHDPSQDGMDSGASSAVSTGIRRGEEGMRSDGEEAGFTCSVSWALPRAAECTWSTPSSRSTLEARATACPPTPAAAPLSPPAVPCPPSAAAVPPATSAACATGGDTGPPPSPCPSGPLSLLSPSQPPPQNLQKHPVPLAPPLSKEPLEPAPLTPQAQLKP